MRHGFPEWFDAGGEEENEEQQNKSKSMKKPPHVVELLQYIRIVFDTQEVLDAVPESAAANNGAWHAWQTFRSKSAAASRSIGEGGQKEQRSLSPRQQPGGARRPGEWNWQGVWEERVRRCVAASASEAVLFGGEGGDVVSRVEVKLCFGEWC